MLAAQATSRNIKPARDLLLTARGQVGRNAYTDGLLDMHREGGGSV
jgi:hypothetical protein